MTVIERKRSADMVADAGSAAPGATQPPHPCFWAVLDSENLNFVFVSTSLHIFLGKERISATMSKSLYDYIHPEEANDARRDLANSFISKSFVGSSTRCRLRRFDLENDGIQHVFRRASESQILLRGRSTQHAHESFERKLSLPSIPDIVKMRANGSQPLSPATPTSLQQPMPKRLRTILEDSVGTFAPAYNSEAGHSADSAYSSGNGSNINEGSSDRPSDDNEEYLIANIGLFLVSARLFVMVCHYEDSASEGLLTTQEPQQPMSDKAESVPQPPVARCDCAASTPIMGDSERVRLLMSQVHKADVIGAAQRFAGASARGGMVHGADGGSAANKGGNSSGGGGGGSSSSLSSRHVQLYSINNEQLLCAFPENAYQRIHSRSPAEAISGGAELCGLWEHCRDKMAKSHAKSLLQGPSSPNANPVQLELQVRSGSTNALADVQSIFFRWGHLLFVCQQMRGDHTPELGAVGGIGVDDSILANYNLSTPASDDLSRSSTAPDAATRMAHVQQHSTGVVGSNIAIVNINSSNGNRSAVRNSSPLNPGSISETRPFSLPRAPASVVANLPLRPTPIQIPEPAEIAPPRRQSSYTLPPVKSFEERRFSYPTQMLYTEHRPPPLPIPQNQQHVIMPPPHQHQQIQMLGVSPISTTPGPGVSRGSPASANPASNLVLSNPGGRLIEVRQRMVVSARSSGTLVGKSSGDTSKQPTPTISPMSAGVVQHTPASLSPAPLAQMQPHSANPGYMQVNMYPPETGAWRWAHTQQPLSAQALPLTPNSSGPGYAQQQSSYAQHSTYAQRPPPPLALGRAMHSSHPHFVHSAHDQYHSPLGSAVASPSMVGPASAHRNDPDKKTCKSCGTDSSPEWRKGPTGHKT
ncbi:hypothetical protein IW148_000151 [Coemansia sp. RSA 1199]|nr:hypothetical protein IW148_000151 [Coemansia sp. RSA 1199]